jgi:hypothetical protein
MSREVQRVTTGIEIDARGRTPRPEGQGVRHQGLIARLVAYLQDGGRSGRRETNVAFEVVDDRDEARRAGCILPDLQAQLRCQGGE